MDGRASWRAESLGPGRVLELGAGRRIRAHVTGEGPPIVFVHGALVNANLWRKVVPRLDGFKRVTLDLPLGSHLDPLPKGADVSPPALAELIAAAVEALELDEVTVVGNDTGGALSQILVTRRPQRVGALVLTSCDAFDNFPPRLFRIVLAPARIPGAIPVALGALRLRAARRLPPSLTGGSRRSQSTARPTIPTCCRYSRGGRCGATCAGSCRAWIQATRSTPR
jgi:pimeloyl-ACP methyl ester carboxylesterase